MKTVQEFWTYLNRLEYGKPYLDKYKNQLKLTLLENTSKFTEAKWLIKMSGIEFVK